MSETRAADDQPWLQGFLKANGGIAGSVHRRTGDELVLAASANLPPPVVAIVQRVPKGKGMAGLAFERREPVQTCNLKSDTSGDVRPGAKAVNAQAAVALPVVDDAGEVRAVVGIAFAGEREIATEELGRLARGAAGLPR
jgi:L-methionine (R)-S-oxide reductase